MNTPYKTINKIVVETDCAECTGREFNCVHLYLCDIDRTCIFRKLYEDLYLGGDRDGN
jgi:hypothetical protein